MMSTTNVDMDVGVTKPAQREILGTDLLYKHTQHCSPHTPLLLTCAYSGEEQQPEETEDGRCHHLIDGSRVDLLVQFGRQVGVVHVIAIH